MKKNFFLMLIVMMLPSGMNCVRAQRPVGDTLMSPSMDTTYYPDVYDWFPTSDIHQWYTHPSDWLLQTGYPYHQGDSYCPSLGYHSNGNLREGNQFFTDHLLKVVGAAACARAQEVFYLPYQGECLNNDSFMCIIDTTLAGRNTDSLILYTFSEDGEPEYQIGGPWRAENPHRHMILPIRDDIWWSGSNHDTVNAALYEVIFDKPVVVEDSFIVAGTANNNELVDMMVPCPLSSQQYGRRYCLFEHRPTRYWSVRAFFDDPEPRIVNWIKVRGGQWKKKWGEWWRTSGGFYIRYFYVIIPIIEPGFDTVLCDAVRDVQLAAATDTTLTLMWTGGNNVEWEVQYAEMNGSEAWTVTTTVPMVTLTGLHERTNYVVRVRGKCEWDTQFGPWSDWTDVFTGAHHDDPPESISNLERFTRMMPNPASDQVTVMSSYRLSRVVVYDLRGHAVLEHDAEGLAATIDVSTLAKGIYVVAIHTPAGTATKRLVVE